MTKIAATVITGFLGSGKTTLIRHLLQHAGGRRLALVINEFGEVGVDREVLLGCGDATCREEDVVELANGCICCTVADDFLPTMEKLLALDPPPDHIVIETSGLALPKPLVKAFAWPGIRDRVTVDGVVTVVDAAAVAAGLFAPDPAAVKAQQLADDNLDHETPLEELFEEQVGCADLVVLNKSDLVPAASWEEVDRAVAHDLRPQARTVRACHGRLPINVLLGLGAAAESDLDSRPSHHEGEDHDHDDFESFAVELGPVSDPDRTAAALAELADRHRVLRLKGFVEVAGKPMRLLVQGVGGRIAHAYDRPWRHGEARSGRLVVIGEKGLDQPGIEAAVRAAA
ncbi:MAG TPA: cobalamin biosynthesis protein CobW [Geminicoccus sp.]|jgi:cobalamin biosynthesis protein CobW|uniref:cobalamin biosynthesis protein CobW n=1 Tax=Geminicoccus sp. TaxID=2024832 RepID=UPI002E35E717|nr:cobalamin biosynthesis protein CobW [Geminicoccus sp.]HEX2527634.1 cobalamin biosynthesis protein CobW [Geminicoccus sp.]